MKYKFEHEFPFDRKTVVAAMFEQGVGEALKPAMKTVLEIETLARDEKDGRITRRVRYLPVPAIKSVGPKKVEPRWMEWIEESEADLATGAISYRNVPTTHKIADLLRNSGTGRFEEIGPNRTRRVLEGELKVDMFLVGAIAERYIAGFAKEILDDEAKALSALIAGRKA